VKSVKIGRWRVRLPNHPAIRIALGVLLVVAGFLGFLPILGFWMVPLGLVVLSVDVPAVRRLRRRAEVKIGRWRQARAKRREAAL
jgi:hypothetical protein